MSIDDDLSEWPPSLHNEDEALAVESAIRAAINTAMNVIRSACSRRVREYQSMVADRDREIGRLEEKLEESDSEVRLLSLELDWRHTEDELSGPITSNAREINHGEHANSSNSESVGAAAPMQISPKCHDTVEAFPHQHNQTEKPSWEGGGAAGDQPFGCIASLVKEESSDLETDIKWEVCEGSLLDQQEGQHGGEYLQKEKPAKEAMEENIASLIKEALSRTTPATLQPMVDAFQDVGVEAVDSTKPIQMDDLTGVLEPIQTHVKGVFSAQSDASHSNMEEDFPRSPQTLVETLRVTTRRSRPSSSRSSLGSLISSPSNRTSPMSAAAFMVAVDQEVIIEDLASFTDALVGMFVCYYVFNLQYPAELGATMEFLQRCIFKINPDKGSKVEHRENKRSNAVNPKVLTLITRISDFEWSA
ncbi:uncharacterized protein LOC142965694 isoform X2 [Anarhichas minor]|uniref:uncharacterized protein LOC142965694 isoform X2 n=1 Tax=Anarhichas minor TaxID=65739 RepID=UPI003F734582